MDDVERQILDAAHEAVRAVGEAIQRDLDRVYGRYAPSVEAKFRKLNAQNNSSVKARAWIGVPKGLSKDQAILGSLRMSRSGEQTIRPKRAKALQFPGPNGETIYRPAAKWPTRVDLRPFNDIVGSFDERIDTYYRSIGRG